MDEEKAIEFWEKYKDSFTPVILLYTKSKVLFIDSSVLFNVSTERRHSISTIITEHIIKQIGEPLEKVFLLSEAWQSKVTKGKKQFTMPSKDPNREEILLIHSKDKNGNMQCTAIPIYKKGKERMLDLKNKVYIKEGYTNILDAFFAGSSAAIN